MIRDASRDLEAYINLVFRKTRYLASGRVASLGDGAGKKGY